MHNFTVKLTVECIISIFKFLKLKRVKTKLLLIGHQIFASKKFDCEITGI